MKDKHILIVANGEITNYDFFSSFVNSADIIIAADGGIKHLEVLNICPDLIMGDFDSIDSIDKYKQIFTESKVEQFPVDKDFTDSELAITKAIDMGASKITMIAVTGKRLDHTLANIMLLRKLALCGIDAMIVDENNKIRYADSSIKIDVEIGSNLSIIPISDKVTGLTLKGLKYTLENGIINKSDTIGISNVCVDKSVQILFDLGEILIFESLD